MRYFHGGVPGLNVGDAIRPAISLGKEHGRSPNQPNYSPHRVYLTRVRWYADLFAYFGEGEVKPVGRAILDPDARLVLLLVRDGDRSGGAVSGGATRAGAVSAARDRPTRTGWGGAVRGRGGSGGGSVLVRAGRPVGLGPADVPGDEVTEDRGPVGAGCLREHVEVSPVFVGDSPDDSLLELVLVGHGESVAGGLPLRPRSCQNWRWQATSDVRECSDAPCRPLMPRRHPGHPPSSLGPSRLLPPARASPSCPRSRF